MLQELCTLLFPLLWRSDVQHGISLVLGTESKSYWEQVPRNEPEVI